MILPEEGYVQKPKHVGKLLYSRVNEIYWWRTCLWGFLTLRPWQTEIPLVFNNRSPSTKRSVFPQYKNSWWMLLTVRDLCDGRNATEITSSRYNHTSPEAIIHNKRWGTLLPRPLLSVSDISRAMSRRVL